jgi:hypothetical protein
MERRSPPQKRTDDHAFPVRVKVLVPERGFENLLLDMHHWLDAAVGRGSYAVHGAGAGLTRATAWYFRTVEEAQAFVTTFPMLVLADGTELPTYQSPNLPFGRGVEWSDPVCNLYSMLKSQEAMRRLFDGLIDCAGNMPPLPGIYPDYSAPIIRNGAEGRELVMARWGMPTPPQYIAGKKVDRGVTKHPADDLVALAGLARTGTPLPRALHQLRGERDLARRLAAAGLVRFRRLTAARLLRRHLGDVDLGAEGQGRTGARRSIRLPDLCAERRGRGHPSQGDAGDPDRASRVGHVVAGALVGGESDATAVARWIAAHCTTGREGGFRGGRCLRRPSRR